MLNGILCMHKTCKSSFSWNGTPARIYPLPNQWHCMFANVDSLDLCWKRQSLDFVVRTPKFDELAVSMWRRRPGRRDCSACRSSVCAPLSIAHTRCRTMRLRSRLATVCPLADAIHNISSAVGPLLPAAFPVSRSVRYPRSLPSTQENFWSIAGSAGKNGADSSASPTSRIPRFGLSPLPPRRSGKELFTRR